MFGGMVLTLPHVKAGRLRALATTGATRSKTIAELPTIAESGLSGFEADEWFGLYAPAGTPSAIVDTLDSAVRTIWRAPETQERFASLGAEVRDMSRPEFEKFVANEIAKWAKVIRAASIRNASARRARIKAGLNFLYLTSGSMRV